MSGTTPDRPAGPHGGLAPRRAPARATAGLARAAALAVALLLVLLAGVAGAGAAHAESYRYWSFWTATGGTWTYSQDDPAKVVPPDGAVNGWRYAVSGPDGATARSPRVAPDFAAVCGATAAVSGMKRIAVILDPGTEVDAPPGATPPAPSAACAVVPVSATATQVVAAASSERLDKGLLCAIGGYPATGCADVVASPPPVPASEAPIALPTSAPAAPAESSSSSPVGLVVALVLLAVLAAGVVRWARRRRA